MGFVYVFESQSFVNGWLKIGSTKDIGLRLKAANNSFVPFDVNCIYAIEVEDPVGVERLAHFAFRDYRKAKEFFEVSLGSVVDFCSRLQKLQMARVLDSQELIQVSEPVFKTLAASGGVKARSRAEATKFAMLEIPVGSKLVYKDDPAKVCVTVDDVNHVKFEGESYSLSALVSGWKGYPASGYLYFLYSGDGGVEEVLWDRRVRLAAQFAQAELPFDDDPEED